jgi:probable DNA metabolism protein
MAGRFVYDGSWNGLLTTFQTCLSRNIHFCEITRKQEESASLFGESEVVQTNITQAIKLKEQIKSKMGQHPLRLIYHAYLSEEKSIDDTLYHYLQIGLKMGKQISNFLTNDYVHRVETIAQKVMREKHRYLGLLRFSSLEDLLYAEFEPEYFILPLLAKPFFDRLGSEDFVIFDKKRKKAVIKEQGELYFQDVDDDLIANLQAKTPDKTYDMLWVTYFKTIAITLRRNLKLQRSRVPFKCVPYLTESIAIQEEYSLGRD